MTEKTLWNRLLRPILHLPQDGCLAYKVQDAFVKGLPDVVCNQQGDVFWIELKVLKHAPVREGTPWKVGVTMEQRRWMEAWNRADEHLMVDPSPDPTAFVLLWVDREKKWYKLLPSIPDSVDPADFGAYVIDTGTKETLARIVS